MHSKATWIIKHQQHRYSDLLGDGASSTSSSSSASASPSEYISMRPSSCDSLPRLLPACLVPLPLEALPLPTDLTGDAGLLEAAFAFAFVFLPASHQQAVSFSFPVPVVVSLASADESTWTASSQCCLL